MPNAIRLLALTCVLPLVSGLAPAADHTWRERRPMRRSTSSRSPGYFFGSSPPAQAMNCQRPPSLINTSM